jgi:UDP-N-acetyl-D-mannosaminuronate dehydrogenase
MLVAIRYSDDFVKTVKSYSDKFNPTLISILSTVPPGTCEIVGSDVTHSTTRGLHPNLETGLREITKHVGGKKAEEVAAIFRLCGIKCVTHAVARTTEAAHILNNASYGVNLMWADEMQKLCRLWGVDYYETVMRYTETNNDGYEALGHKTKVRMILTPPGGEIGGHCVKQSANLVPENDRTAMLAMLAKYDKEVKP